MREVGCRRRAGRRGGWGGGGPDNGGGTYRINTLREGGSMPAARLLAEEAGRASPNCRSSCAEPSTTNSFFMTLVQDQKGVAPELCRFPLRTLFKDPAPLIDFCADKAGRRGLGLSPLRPLGGL